MNPVAEMTDAYIPAGDKNKSLSQQHTRERKGRSTRHVPIRISTPTRPLIFFCFSFPPIFRRYYF